jgi:hypothetical protein
LDFLWVWNFRSTFPPSSIWSLHILGGTAEVGENPVWCFPWAPVGPDGIGTHSCGLVIFLETTFKPLPHRSSFGQKCILGNRAMFPKDKQFSFKKIA